MRIFIAAAMVVGLAGPAMADNPRGINSTNENSCLEGAIWIDGQCTQVIDTNRSVGPRRVSSRTYTLDEIGRMRSAVAKMMVAQAQTDCDAYVKKYSSPNAMIIGCPNDVSLQSIELNVQTYINAGIAPEALEAKARCPAAGVALCPEGTK